MSEDKHNIHQQVIKRATTSPEVSAFEQIKREDENGEYWSARELAKLLGYTLWQNFERVIAEAKEVCAINGGDVERLFIATNRKSRGRDATDYHLARHACYIIAESADGRKPQVAFAKIYFALTTERFELLAQTDEDRLRIEQRQKLLRHNAALALQARAAGVMTDREFAHFFNEGYLGLYMETVAQIRVRMGLRGSQDISDHMGSLETAANDFRAALARQLLIDRGVADKYAAYNVHHEAGASVRALLVEKGIYPERLPTPSKSYQQLLREEEVRQRLLLEDQTGLWARLLAGQVDSLDDSLDESDEDDAPAD